MEPEVHPQQNVPTTPPVEPVEQTPKPAMHTYANDLANALDTTDATVIQQIMKEGKEREADEAAAVVERREQAWYKAGAIILILCTLGAGGYSAYYYTHLTVPAEKTPSVGVFPSTTTVVAPDTSITKVLASLGTNETLEDGRPYLIPLVSDERTLTLLSNTALFSFFEANPSEPFLTSFHILRYGVMKQGTVYVPFIIGSTKDTDISTKELLIAEPDLLQMLHKPLGIDLTLHAPEIGKSFSGGYMFNIPVRTLRYDTEEKKGELLFLYGRASEDIVVFTTAPSALKAIYDSLIQQR
jgi:hypothetical protein